MYSCKLSTLDTRVLSLDMFSSTRNELRRNSIGAGDAIKRHNRSFSDRTNGRSSVRCWVLHYSVHMHCNQSLTNGVEMLKDETGEYSILFYNSHFVASNFRWNANKCFYFAAIWNFHYSFKWMLKLWIYFSNSKHWRQPSPIPFKEKSDAVHR